MAVPDSYTVKIARKLASYEGINPEELDPPLYEVINTDAMENLFKEPGPRDVTPDATLEFTYKNYTVRVSGSGSVSVKRQNSFIIE